MDWRKLTCSWFLLLGLTPTTRTLAATEVARLAPQSYLQPTGLTVKGRRDLQPSLWDASNGGLLAGGESSAGQLQDSSGSLFDPTTFAWPASGIHPAPASSGGRVFTSSAATQGPPLSIRNSGDGVIVAWPLPATGWVLEHASHLDRPVPWTRVPPRQYQTNATSAYIAVSLPEENSFYRLRQLGPLVPGLTGQWSLDEGQGNVALDASGHENTLFLTNVDWSLGRIGPGALRFNGEPAGAGGSLAWVSNANYRVLPSQGQPFSVSLWFNPDAWINGWSGLLGNDANGSNGWHLASHTAGPGSNELVFASTGPGASLSVTGCTLLLPGQWHELTATFDGNEGILYLDSQLLARGSGTLLANDDPIYFGGGVGGFDSFLGRIDEVRAYTNLLSQEGISLNGYWRFDENAGGFAVDSSRQGHHASVSDLTAWVPGKEGSGIDLSNSTVLIF